MDEWISTVDSLPKEGQIVFICIYAGNPMLMNITLGWIDPVDKCWRNRKGKVQALVTHWKPRAESTDTMSKVE